eukprot:CAMPEP_0185737758 /NCGR_PEP_ID=MMETSP1171-20130828/31223_1 /TAXON_ID=374046 /ORGANISM="Helicotheca tamensis, Strain CCMP826" /LENGTH=46 /DNA_ID= /DNA_START= /DNA_END= /DNA_ORIENTATION=
MPQTTSKQLRMIMNSDDSYTDALSGYGVSVVTSSSPDGAPSSPYIK